MKASLLFTLLVVALLCGIATAKLSKQSRFKLSSKPTINAVDVLHASASKAKETNKKGITGPPFTDLPSCTFYLTLITEEEAILDAQRDECLAELAPLVEQDTIYHGYRDANHSRAMACLLNLTECNDRNEPLVVDGISKRSVRSVYDESIVNHPYKKEERKIMARIAAIDMEKYTALLSPKKMSVKDKREVLQCTLDECNELASLYAFIANSLANNISWCQAEIQYRKNSIMTFKRFSTLWMEEWQTCEPIADKCNAGLRQLLVTFQNGDFDNLQYLTDFEPGWVGFTNDSTNNFYTSGQDSESLTALRFANATPISLTFPAAGAFDTAVSSSFGQGVLGNHQAWSYLYEVNPLNNDYLFFAFPFSQTLDVGDYGKFAVSPNGLQIFDGVNFVHQELPVRKKKRSPKQKRGPLAGALAECGCVGDPLPFYQPHEYYAIVNYTTSWDGVYYGETGNGIAAIIAEELRWTVPYPPGIRPEVLPPGAKR